MTAKRFTARRGWVDAAALSGRTSESKEVREVEILGPPDEFDRVEVRPIGATPISVHRRWLRDNPVKGY